MKSKHNLLIKTFTVSASVLMLLSAGSGINNVNAKHRHYHYRSHRIYKRNHGRRRHVSLRAYIYNVKKPSELREMASYYGEYMTVKKPSVKKMLHKFSKNGKSILAFDMAGGFFPVKAARQQARENHQSFKTWLSGMGPVKGAVKPYRDNSDHEILYYSNSWLKATAKVNHMSVKKYKFLYLSKAGANYTNTKTTRSDYKDTLNMLFHRGHKISKYWYSKGYPTKLLLKTADRDAIKDLNKQRESQGINPLTQDPYLQKLADNYSKREYFVSGVNPKYLTHRQRKVYYRIKRETQDDMGGAAYDDYMGVYMPKYSPKTLAKTENGTMQSSNNIRLNPAYTTVGISIWPIRGDFMEIFGIANHNYAYHPHYHHHQGVSPKQETLADLNQDRASVNESPLYEDSTLDSIAQERSRQLVNNFSHYDSNGNPYVYDDGLNSDNWAENIAMQGGSGASAADKMNTALFYQEEASHGGHYENIINNNNVGIGITKANGNTYLAEDFD